MLARATMLHCNNALLAGAALSLSRHFRKYHRSSRFDGSRRSLLVAAISILALVYCVSENAFAQKTPNQPAPTSPLAVDHDPVRSPDSANAAPYTGEAVHKEGGGFVLHTDVEEVVLNATVLDGNKLVQDLKKENFTVFEDGVK